MNICTSEIVPLLELIGIFFNIFKLSLPLILIALGIFDFYKAVVGDDYSVLKKQVKRFIYRLVAAILIFFLPNIVLLIFSIVNVEKNQCVKCILDTNQCKVVSENDTSSGDKGDNTGNGIETCDIEDESCISDAIYKEGN